MRDHPGKEYVKQTHVKRIKKTLLLRNIFPDLSRLILGIQDLVVGTANGKICVMRTGGCNGFVLSAQIAHEICLPICLLYTTIFSVEENDIFLG